MTELNRDQFESFDDDEEIVDTSDSFAPDSAALAEVDVSSDTFYETEKINSWEFRSRMAKFESEKEFSMFRIFCEAGSGRSTKYISFTYNLPESRVLKIADKNNWAKRAADYDKNQLQIMLAQERTARAEEHKRKLEEYRMQQEFIGRSLSADAAKLAAIVSNTLDKFIAEERQLDVRDLPAMLNAANKAAEIGRNLQSSSLGVDQLLTALEEYEE